MSAQLPARGHALLLRYTDAHHATAAAALHEKVLERLTPALAWDVTVLDNALPPGAHGASPEGWEIQGGDNSLKEFSGWQAGLDRLCARDAHDVWADGDAVILVNDTFHRNYDVSYLERFGLVPALEWALGGALVGHVDLYPREIELFGLPMRHWLRTSFILARWDTLRRLLPLRPPLPPEALFAASSTDGGEALFAPDAPLSPLYVSYLESFLLGRAGEYGCRWHTTIPRDPAGLAALRLKAYTILCEHWLAARARELHIPLRDVSGQLSRREADMDAMAQNSGDPA